MKKILITGVNSYIGTSFQEWVLQYPDKYSVESISVKDDGWKESSFNDYDVVFHTAAIVHVSENDTNKYFKVNRDLTIELANKAKNEGVKQFIFLSTMGVYGTETGYISEDTIPTPKTPYAQSIYEAEQLLLNMGSADFNIAILRPPIVYGKNCPGNYTKLARMAKILPLFPKIENERSMIFIDNLSEFIRLTVDHNLSGIYFPQNKEFVNTSFLVSLIAKANNKKIKQTKMFNWAVDMCLKKYEIFRKVFGSFVYDKGMLGGPGTLINGKKIDYETLSFKESIANTESRG